MADVIFVKPKHEYASYADLWRLVELNGYTVIEPDAMKPRSKNTYILPCWNGEFPDDGWNKPNARIVRWLFEWGIEEKRAGIAEYWCSDKWNAGQNDAKYVPLGGDVRLRNNVNMQEIGGGYVKLSPNDFATRGQLDIAFPAYLTNRRMWVRDRLREKGIEFNHIPDNFEAAATAWGAERNAVYNAARLAMHIHQDGTKPALPPLRLVVAAAYRLPFLSETVPDQGDFYGKLITEDYDRLVERVPYWLSQDLTGYADALYAYLCEEWTFEKCLTENL